MIIIFSLLKGAIKNIKGKNIYKYIALPPNWSLKITQTEIKIVQANWKYTNKSYFKIK